MKKLNFKIIVLLVTLGSLFLSVTFAKIAEKQSAGSYKELFRRSYTTNLQFNGKENHLNLENQFEYQKKIKAQNIDTLEIISSNSDLVINDGPAEDIQLSMITFYDQDQPSDSRSQDLDRRVVVNQNKLTVDLQNLKSEINVQKGSININWNDMIKLISHLDTLAEELALNIKIPKSIKKVVVKSISGDLNLKADHLQDIQLETISGDAHFEGKVDHLNARSVSGDMKLVISNQNPQILFETTSGNLDLVFKTQPQIRVDFKTTSGELQSEWPELKGSSVVRFESVSGDLNIYK